MRLRKSLCDRRSKRQRIGRRVRMSGVADWIGALAMLAVCGVIALWMAGAIYYDLSGGKIWGRAVALCWLVGVVVLFSLWQPLWKPLLAFLGVVAMFLLWWLRQKPSHDRDWEPAVAVLPRAIRKGE